MSETNQPIGGERRRRVAMAEADAIASGLSGDRPPGRVDGKTRRPFGSQRQKLAYPSRAGFHRHWFNDEPGRIEEALEAGYEHVKHETKHVSVSTVVGTARGGGALHAYLMEIPIQWYEEDMASREAEYAERIRAIKQGDFAKPQGADGALRYAGSTRGDIVIREGDRR